MTSNTFDLNLVVFKNYNDIVLGTASTLSRLSQESIVLTLLTMVDARLEDAALSHSIGRPTYAALLTDIRYTDQKTDKTIIIIHELSIRSGDRTRRIQLGR